MTGDCVVDASVGIKLFVVEELSDAAHRLFRQLTGYRPARFYVPDLFFVECANTLWKYVRRFGYPPEKRGFSPHLTLGRMGRRASRDDAAQVGEVVATTTIEPLAEVTVDRFALIRSVLKPTGAEYTTLQEFLLMGG